MFSSWLPSSYCTNKGKLCISTTDWVWAWHCELLKTFFHRCPVFAVTHFMLNFYACLSCTWTTPELQTSVFSVVNNILGGELFGNYSITHHPVLCTVPNNTKFWGQLSLSDFLFLFLSFFHRNLHKLPPYVWGEVFWERAQKCILLTSSNATSLMHSIWAPGKGTNVWGSTALLQMEPCSVTHPYDMRYRLEGAAKVEY